MTHKYFFLPQAKAVAAAFTIFVICYFLDKNAHGAPYFRRIEDYLQFITPLYACFIAFFCNDFKPSLKPLATSLAAVMAIVYTIKYFVNAKRPNGVGGFSFPSGHTSFAFTAAAFIHKRYSFYYAIPAYANSIAIAFLRVFHGKHHAIDVICGAVIGIVIAWKFTTKKEVQ